MLLNELFAPAISGLQDLSDDNSKPVYKASRKTKLTLQQIRKLRRMMDVRAYENKLYLDKVRIQYGAQPEGDAGAAPGVF